MAKIITPLPKQFDDCWWKTQFKNSYIKSASITVLHGISFQNKLIMNIFLTTLTLLPYREFIFSLFSNRQAKGDTVIVWFLLDVLILSGIELNFFIVASIGLYFAFMLKTVLITLMCYFLMRSTYTVSKLFLFFLLPHQQVGCGCTKSWEGHSRVSWPQQTRKVFCTRWCHAQQ